MISSEERKANLKRLINNKGKSVAEFCRENDLDPSYISQLLNGHRNIGEKAARKIEEKANLKKGILDETNNNSEQTTPTKEHRIPVIGMAQLGDGGHWLAYDHPDSYVQWYSDDPNAYAVQGIGDSMQPRIKHKEFVIIEPNHPIMNGDEVFVVTVDGRRMVKIYSYTKDDRVHLESENKEHEKIILDKSEVLFMHYVTGIAKSSKMFV